MQLLILLSLVGLTSGFLFFHRPGPHHRPGPPHRPGPTHRPPPPRPSTHGFGGLSNVARGKPVSASSRHPNYGNTGKLTDGGKATNIAQCFQTADVEHSSNRWVRVDLGRLWGVQEVYLLNRGDCCGNRLRNFEVDVARSLTNPGGVEQVTSQTCFSRAAAIPQGQGIRTRCTQPIIGRYVTVILHSSSEPLHFCEFEVYGSPVTNPCISRPCRSPSICRVKTDRLNIWHECGCANGYRGPSCNIPITACDSNPCQNGGQCRPNGLGFTCSCVNGFSGSNCGTRPAPCASNPCSNGGRCNANGASYTCSCVGGFSGTNCQNAPNPCASNPCANGGRCNVNGGSYTCSCSAGYSGFNCQTAPNPCSPNPCRNGGRCSRNGASFTCVCVGSYTGPTCASLSDPCHPNPCKNGGVCSTVVSGGKLTAKCFCAEGYEGTMCQTVKDPCHPSPCKNNGICSTTVVGGALTFKCYCTSGYGGQTCSSVNDPCSSSPCKNGGRCSASGQGGFSCVCINGYSGNDCTQTADPCSTSPCKNGGMCRNIVQNGALVASCVCAPGFTGDTCSQENNPCSSRPCKNGGTCSPQLTRSAATFKCTCKTGFSGETCDQKVDLSGACSSSPCLNGASCRPTSYGSYKCTCPALYQGDNCQIKSEWVNAPCGNSAGCTGENTVCFKGKCLCTPGYYYSVSSQKCIKSCPKSDMVGSYMIYPEARIKKNKDAKELNLNPDECKAVCNKDKNCLSISMLEKEIKPKCFLHTVTVQDVPNDWAPMKDDWDYYQRHCK